MKKFGIVVMVMVLAVSLSAAPVVASDFKSWRTGTGVVVQDAGNAYLQQGRARILEPGALHALLFKDTDPSNDPLILDVRFGTDFDGPLGHIPGAIWIADFNKMAEPENLDALDAALAAHILATGNDDIVVYCHLGQMSGLITGVLGSIGYDVKTLKLGYNMGWIPFVSGTGGMGGM